MILETLSAMRDLGRLHDLASILIRYGFGDLVKRAGLDPLLEKAGRALHWTRFEELLHLDPPQRVRRALEEMGPTFIKFGQILATRVDLFPRSGSPSSRSSTTGCRPCPSKPCAGNWRKTSAHHCLGYSPSSIRFRSARRPSPRCTGPACTTDGG